MKGTLAMNWNGDYGVLLAGTALAQARARRADQGGPGAVVLESIGRRLSGRWVEWATMGAGGTIRRLRSG